MKPTFNKTHKLILLISTIISTAMHASKPENKISHENGFIKKTYGAITEECIDSSSDKNYSFDIHLSQEIIHTYKDPIRNEPLGFIKKERIGTIQYTYHAQEAMGYIKSIEIYDPKNHKKGYGSRLCKQAVANIFRRFPLCSQIAFTAYPFRDSANLKAHEKLVSFYSKLGALQTSSINVLTGTRMVYPARLAALLDALLPIFEPTSYADSHKAANHYDALGIIHAYAQDI